MARQKNPWFDLLAHVRPVLKKKGVTAPGDVSKIAKKFYTKANKDGAKAIELFDKEYK